MYPPPYGHCPLLYAWFTHVEFYYVLIRVCDLHCLLCVTVYHCGIHCLATVLIRNHELKMIAIIYLYEVKEIVRWL